MSRGNGTKFKAQKKNHLESSINFLLYLKKKRENRGEILQNKKSG
jgi:hypothetical protein